MSEITQLRDGKLSLVQFAEKVVDEFEGSPVVVAFELVILSALRVEITSLTKSPTLAALITTSVAARMKGGTPALTEAVTGAVSEALGLASTVPAG